MMVHEGRQGMQSIPVLFDPLQQADGNVSLSPSASKPARALASWQAAGFPIEVRSFEPVPVSLLRRIHDPDHVDGILAGVRPNGFGNTNRAVAESLIWTNGSMVAAAREALGNGRVACSPTSGFHHAQNALAHGFCTFNGLVAAVVAVTDDGFQARIGILDLDAHWADGTHDVLESLPEGAVRAEHYSFGGDPLCYSASGIPEWMRRLPAIVEGMASRCGLILYQAGADPHIDDPFGGMMTTAQMQERDRVVFRTCARLGVPVAWNLAGGYQEPFEAVLGLHDTTMRECVDAYIQAA